MVKSLYIKILAGIVIIMTVVVLYLLFMDGNAHTHYTLMIVDQARSDVGDAVFVENVKKGEIISLNEVSGPNNRIYYLIQLPENIHIPKNSNLEVFSNSDSSEMFFNIELHPSYDYYYPGDTLVYAGEMMARPPAKSIVNKEPIGKENVKDSLPMDVIEEKEKLKNGDPGIIFKVQVLVSLKELDLNSKRFCGLNDIQIVKEGKNFKYFFGKPDSFENAVQLQEKAREAGLKEAFVVAYQDGKRISLKEARSLRK